MRVDRRHSQSRLADCSATGCVPHQFVANEGVHVGVLQAGGEGMPQSLGSRDLRHSDLARNAHEFLADPVFLQGPDVPPDGLRGGFNVLAVGRRLPECD